MKKLLSFLFLFLFFYGNAFSQNYGWITPNKTYLKVYTADDGMYRINKTDFTNAGINANSIDPRTVKVYSQGIQIPVYFNGEQDGVFDVNDFMDFYGKRRNGGITSTYDHNNIVLWTTNEYYNSYSDTNVYWIDWGGSNGIRYTTSNYSTLTNYSSSFSNDLIHLERDYFYNQGEVLNGSDLRFLSTEKFRGEGWYWATLYDNQTLSDTFSTPLLYTTPQTATVRIWAYPTNKSNTPNFVENNIEIRINGTLIASIANDDMNRIDSVVSFSSSLLSNSAANSISVKYVPNAGYSGSMYIDLMEVQYPKTFKFRNSRYTANLGGSDTTSKQFKISGYNSLNPVNIYDVSNNIRINSVSFTADTLKFSGKSNGNFEIMNNDITKKPLRIKQRLVPDLLSASNGADYLIIYNKAFVSQAEQLRAYRQTHDSFRSFKAEVEDIYDIFNFGLEDPEAIRNFTNYAYNSWQLPKMSYICLLGRASLDPKKNLSSSAYSTNFVPAYGFPPSDGYFANFNIGTFCYYDQIAIGRLPAYYTSEAQTMVDKIIAYESQSPADWSKDFIFITGGGTASEQFSHQQKSNFEINTYITPPPISGDPHKIYRSDTSGVPSFNLKDSIRNDISRGCLFVNYRGHAGSHDWEVAMNDPGTLSNGNKLPLILSLTCFTGENGKSDYRGFGERFIYFADKGAIGFVGTTGWSYAQYGNDFGSHVLQTFKSDTARRIGNLTKYAQTKMSRDSLSFSIRHTLNCYSLLGDPAVKLNLPVRPELSISNADYKLSNNFPALGDNITLSVYPKNYGTNCDSSKIRLQLKKDNQSYLVKDTVIRNFGLEASLDYNFKIDSVGIYNATVTLDQSNWIPLENKSNNVLSINIPVKNTAFVPLKPVNNSVIGTDSVEFTGLNPRVKSLSNNIKVILQLDTSSLFNSPVLKTFVNNSISGVATKFKTSVPVMVNNKSHFWRTNCIINNDSSGWSAVQNFIYLYSGDITSGNSNKASGNNPDPAVSLLKINANQFSASDLSNVNFKPTGMELTESTINLYVKSYGSNAEESSFFGVGNKSIFIDGGENTGLCLLKVKKLTGSIISFKNLKMNSSTSSDSLVTFLNTYDSTHYLMLLNAAYVAGGRFLTAVAKTKLKQFGSKYCDSVGLMSYFHTWSLIGYLGANNSQVAEMYDQCCFPAPSCTACDHWSPSVSEMNVTVKKPSGTVSTLVGPAQSWSDFSWTQTLNPNSSIKFDVYGVDQNNQQTLLLSNLQTYQFNNLSSINAYQYPKLNLVSKLNIDTVVGKLSPVLGAVKVNYIAPAEITWNVNSLKINSSYEVGEDLKFSFDYYNPGYSAVSGAVMNVYKKNINVSNLIMTDTITYNLKVDSLKNYLNKFIVPYFRDSMKIIVELKSKGQDNEFYTYNNNVEFTMNSVHSAGPATSLQVFSDNHLLNNGDYVTLHPEIKIVFSNSEILGSLMSDTSKLALRINDKYIPYFVNGKINTKLKLIDKDNPASTNENTVMYYPDLTNGTNRLSLSYYSGTDNMDTVYYDVLVSDELAIKDLYNFPNPMKSETSFIFNLAGSFVPSKFRIKIYTVSGKLIKQIESPVNIGNNQIPWDGRDDDGDFIANGTYLYKVFTEDDSGISTQTQKLVVLK